MKNFRLLLLCLLVFISSCNNSAKNTPEAFDQLLEDYYQESLELYPLNATSQGDNRYNDFLPNDLTDDFRNKEKISNCFNYKTYQIK